MYHAPADVADALGVSSKTVLRLISEGKLTAHRLGERTIRISDQAIADYLASVTTAAGR